MTPNEADNARIVIETFWEFESGWGAGSKEIRAAIELQEAVGYTTESDAARAQCLEAAVKDEQS